MRKINTAIGLLVASLILGSCGRTADMPSSREIADSAGKTTVQKFGAQNITFDAAVGNVTNEEYQLAETTAQEIIYGEEPLTIDETQNANDAINQLLYDVEDPNSEISIDLQNQNISWKKFRTEMRNNSITGSVLQHYLYQQTYGAMTLKKPTKLSAEWTKRDFNRAALALNISLSSPSRFNSFSSMQRSTPYNEFKWENDGCTLFPNHRFTPACVVHDFGYRNTSIYFETHRLSVKRAVDFRFFANMMSNCGLTTNWGCYATAGGFYAAVSLPFVDAVWLYPNGSRY